MSFLIDWQVVIKKFDLKYIYRNMVTIVFIVVLMMFATPLLNSLTRRVQSGSLRLIVGFLILVHIASYDYVAAKSNTDLTQNGRFKFSLNMIYFAAILLSSRFKDDSKAFAFLLFSAFLFAY